MDGRIIRVVRVVRVSNRISRDDLFNPRDAVLPGGHGIPDAQARPL